MARRVQAVIVCEDRQHAVFVRAFLLRRRMQNRNIRVEWCKKGDARKHVSDRFAIEVRGLRKYSGTDRMLVAMTDADNLPVKDRLGKLHKAVAELNLGAIGDDEPIFLFAPKWNIETWLEYLRGKAVDENESRYPNFNKESEAYSLVDHLVDMCDRQSLQPTPPPSLEAACRTYERMKEFLSRK